jgi:hypothetical protein
MLRRETSCLMQPIRVDARQLPHRRFGFARLRAPRSANGSGQTDYILAGVLRRAYRIVSISITTREEQHGLDQRAAVG